MYIWVCKSVKLLRAEAGSDAERTCLARLASNQMPCVNSEYVHVIDQGSSHDAMGSIQRIRRQQAHASIDVPSSVKPNAPKAQSSDWSKLPKSHALVQTMAKLGGMIEEAGYSEMYGVELSCPVGDEAAVPGFSTLLILQKFLRANAGNVDKACEQLLGALKWRKAFKPLEVKKQVFDGTKFEGLGYVTHLKKVPGSINDVDVATFNIYGAVKDTNKTFGHVDE
jgi:hypothetical protein